MSAKLGTFIYLVIYIFKLNIKDKLWIWSVSFIHYLGWGCHTKGEDREEGITASRRNLPFPRKILSDLCYKFLSKTNSCERTLAWHKTCFRTNKSNKKENLVNGITNHGKSFIHMEIHSWHRKIPVSGTKSIEMIFLAWNKDTWENSQ